MYRVEINGSEVLMDLIGRMADLAGAEYQTRLVLETESTRLASAVSVLLGEPVQVDPELAGLVLGLKPEVSEEKPAGGGLGEHVWNFNAEPGGPIVVTHEGPANGKVNGKPAAEAGGARCRYCKKPIAKGRTMCQGAECQRKAKHEMDARYAEKRKARKQAQLAAKSYGKCEFCEQPRLPRSKICGDPECEKKLNQKHQLAYLARKAARAGESAQAEVAKSEVPFAGKSMEPEYEVNWPDVTLTVNFKDLMEKNRSGEIPDGTMVRARPSGRLYVVCETSLTRADLDGEGRAR